MNYFRVSDFFRVLRPTVVRRLFFSKVSTISVSCSDDVDRDLVIRCLRFRYEVPIVGSLPEMFLKDVPRLVNDSVVVKCIEDYLFSSGDVSRCLKLLARSGIINRSGLLTKLGAVMCLVLAPFAVDESVLEILRL
ncbi:MAG: hypothetical protein GXO23_02915 [Crenarchaeota archaeon]|nr:hypothetical protein [Thermoproteota archaeon]